MRVRIRLSATVTFAVASILLLVSGCGRASSATKGPSPSGDAGQEASVHTTAAREITQDGHVAYPKEDYIQSNPGRPGGVLRISTQTDPSNLDPHGVSFAYIQWLGRIVFDNLIYLDTNGVAQPWLAKSWEVSPDGKTYTFHLRDDVTFSDSSRFDAEAVKINLEHMRDPATRSPLAGRYIAPYADGRVIDAFTFEAHLKQPYTPFLNVLAQSWLAMISPKQIRENPHSILTNPIGSGPYLVESYTRQQGIKFVRRKDYHWAPALLHHEGPAYLDRIEVDVIPEALVRYTSLASGQYDFTLEAPAANAAAIRSDDNLVLDRRIRQGIPARAIAFNIDKPPFDDVRVRRALALALDREGIAQITGFGEYQTKTDFLAATTRFYDPSFRDALKYNPAEANRLLDQAGWTARNTDGIRTKDGQRLAADFLTTETYTPSAMVVAIQSDFRKVGFDLHIVEMPQTQLSDRRIEGAYQSVAAGVWHTNTPDALYINHHSDEITTPARIGQNTSHLRDAVFDDLVDRARQTSDPVILQDLYSRAQKRLTEVVPSVPIYENYSFVAYRKRVHGVLFDTSHNTPLFIGAWLTDSDK
ncbi:MAG TPA: ABC transporter substrate-binding protein [Opitutaceae bacterium]